MRLIPRRKGTPEEHPQMVVEREVERARRRRRRPRLPRPQPRAPSPDRLAVGSRSLLIDLLGIVREMVAWPARLWMGVAERVGRVVLWVWRRTVYPVLLVIARASAWALHWGEREVTPARGLCVVALAASVALGGSQFADYHAVQVGAPEYQSVAGVAPPPEVDQQSPRSAHGVSVFVLAAVSLFVTVFAAARNWRLARLLLFLGAAVVMIALIGDLPQGLREGSAAIDYEGANAVLLGGFWAELFAGVTLMVVGPLLAVRLRSEREARRAQARRGTAPRGQPLRPARSGTGMEEPAT
jgi:hypothetical protein